VTGQSALSLSPGGLEPPWVDDVLRFWFGELAPKAWFSKDTDVDAAIAKRFEKLVANLGDFPADLPVPDARTALATVLALDQFPRNIFRNDPRAFAFDGKARDVAGAAVDAGLDATLDVPGRLFIYLPFEHSEYALDQQRSVDLISALGDAEYTRYAVAHKVIIDRFRRFPHRNAILRRPSTPEEIAFLATPGSAF
jgi:uncharacterized protein (DUF924 family)